MARTARWMPGTASTLRFVLFRSYDLAHSRSELPMILALRSKEGAILNIQQKQVCTCASMDRRRSCMFRRPGPRSAHQAPCPSFESSVRQHASTKMLRMRLRERESQSFSA